MAVGSLFLVALLQILFPGAWALRGVHLEILPEAVRRGENATLLCLYDLEGAPLYSVKWYRGSHEFFRFSPQETPKAKIFPFEGVNVDFRNSNASQVTLLSVGFKLSGNISCEVTTDAPAFSSALVSHHMMVIDLPERGPTVITEKNTYDVGETLRANCTSPPSRPHATLSFLLNNIPVGKPEDSFVFSTEDSRQWSSLSLEVVLEPQYFSNRGILELKCTALVTTLYRNTTQVQLKSSISEPIPERVTLPSQAAPGAIVSAVLLALLPTTSTVLR
ncbi:uncharacterized protein [Bemisia tabaci]|uniref:uncharacterized protein n=1 Tax=Bemisia tabaci TaxID=7038 RepID=UPI003B28498E